MNLINQIMCQEIVPECPAAGNQNIFARLAFEFGNLLVGVCTSDDADIGPVSSERIRDDDVRHGLARLADLSLAGGPLLRGGVPGDLRPEIVEQLEGYSASNSCVGCTEPFGSIRVEDAAHDGEHD